MRQQMVRLLMVSMLMMWMLPSSSSAQQFIIMGAGGNSCGQWLQARQNRANLEMGAWVLGYLSGVSASGSFHGSILRGVDRDGIFFWLDNYCRSNPLHLLAIAAQTFAEERGRQVR